MPHARVRVRTSSDLHSLRVGKNWKGKKIVNRQQNCSKMVIVLRSILRVEKYTNLERKKRLKCLNISLKWLYLYMFYATWIWFVFLRETWLLAFFCEREAVFRIFHDAWKGQLLLREGVFRRYTGNPLFTDGVLRKIVAWLGTFEYMLIWSRSFVYL